ncbi:hypothetical protein BT96DRAFT_1048540 [Gymnopus androsaceus JB14]|uniref:Helicase ATP-binding domain-containing protein n=1 Tax=Gymnopus androsaceus JB14 TaxID=1447944 RepID=A0A6A4H8Z6_9AGAR|nr:hypothetical protein BT96DRAFT_1048540 [Gymnopus androsaceus JB14]
MALSPCFDALFKDGKFQYWLKVVIADEAHCIDEWGDDDFHPLYHQLNQLCPFTGQEVPFLACTATCRMQTFNLLWDTLDYGDHSFWGIDIGCD